MQYPEKENFLRLLRSEEEVNVVLALQLAEGLPELKEYIRLYEEVYQVFFDNNLQEINASQIAKLNETNCSPTQKGITHIPKAIKVLKKTRTLWLNNNQLKTLPPEIANLESLLMFWLNDNQIKVIPPEIGQLPQLKYLFIHNNQVEEIPKEIKYLQHLVEFGLRNNRIKKLDESIFELTKLKVLALSGNLIEDIPKNISAMSGLNHLDLRDNPIPAYQKEDIRAWLPDCDVRFD